MSAQFQDAVQAALVAVPSDQIRDIYALSFFIYDEEDDPRRPTLTLGYNTISRWRESIDGASSPEEAKWNYAFWLQNELLVLGRNGSQSAEAISRWIGELGLSYSDEDEAADFKRCLDVGQTITSSFVGVACDLAATLHSHGTIDRIFGQPVPIIIHELEYYDGIADQTERSNPSGLVQEFVAWVREGTP